jgi:hypothetical protein
LEFSRTLGFETASVAWGAAAAGAMEAGMVVSGTDASPENGKTAGFGRLGRRLTDLSSGRRHGEKSDYAVSEQTALEDVKMLRHLGR